MQDLSLHLLDIAENSIRAGATLIEIEVNEKNSENELVMAVSDNGKGIPPEWIAKVYDPFVTSRTLRKVGLGIPLFKQRCELCGGDLVITSETGKGTTVKATMQYDHIDRVPLGDLSETMITLILGKPQIDYRLLYTYEEKRFIFDTREIKSILHPVSISDFEIIKWLKNYLNENLNALK